MREPEKKRNNHYLPRSYLKRWAEENGRIWTYRLLVSHASVPLWKLQSTKGVTYHEHLYTRVMADEESDEIERWFDRDFESPAEEPIRKVIANQKLSPADWKRLVRFLAAQDVRTPARLMENMKRWQKTLPAVVEQTMKDYALKLGDKGDHKSISNQVRPSNNKYFPGRVALEKTSNHKGAQLKFETVIGRSLWIFGIKKLLSETLNALLDHKWTILRSPQGIRWLTSDDPVVKLNYYRPGKYDFGGGWGRNGTEIFLPLGPGHLMYTLVGKRPPQRNSLLSDEQAEFLQKITVEHAHRLVFAMEKDKNVARWRPRTVDCEAFKSEQEQWRKWDKDQREAERRLYFRDPGSV